MLSDDPPSYETIMAEFQASLDAFGPDLKPQNFLDTYNLLPATHITVLAANVQDFPTIPDEKSDAYITGALNALSTPEVAGHMDTAAGSAAQACTVINGIFVELIVDISNLETTYNIPDRFSPRLDSICKVYHPITALFAFANIRSHCSRFRVSSRRARNPPPIFPTMPAVSLACVSASRLLTGEYCSSFCHPYHSDLY